MQTEIIATIANDDVEGAVLVVARIPSGFSVVIFDTDAEMALPSVKIFPDATPDRALAYALAQAS
jgi:hypothetical protein